MPDTYTPNLNLKKPGYDSPADIADINANMDKIDTSVNQLSQQKVDKANVVNNFTTTEEGFVADARVLKALNDKFTKSTFVFTPSIGITVTTSRLIKNEFMADVSLELKADAEIAAYASLGSFNVGITGIFGVASVGGATVDFYTHANSLFFRKAISANGVARLQFTCII